MPNRRTVLAGAAALPIAAALPAWSAIAAEVAELPRIDRAAFASRLHQWALHVPEMGRRVDAMLVDVDRILATEDGMEEMMEAWQACRDGTGRKVSFDWLFIGEGRHPNGDPHKMFMDEPERPEGEDPHEPFVQAVVKLDPKQKPILLMTIQAMLRGDYADARAWMDYARDQAGIAIKQI